MSNNGVAIATLFFCGNDPGFDVRLLAIFGEQNLKNAEIGLTPSGARDRVNRFS